MTNFDKNMFCTTDEQTIVEAEASIIMNKTIAKGNLVLTNCRLMFNVNGKLLQEFKLDKVNALSTSKPRWLFSNGFSMIYNDFYYKFQVKYPGDWIRLIKYQKQLNNKVY